jgi:hypothetical protein
MSDESLTERMQRLASERARILQEEELMRAEAQQELETTNRQIEALEEKRDALESFLNIKDAARRLQHGTLRNLCIKMLKRNPSGLTSGQIKELIEKENPGMRVGSVPASLSYQTAQGRLKRDEFGRYFLLE